MRACVCVLGNVCVSVREGRCCVMRCCVCEYSARDRDSLKEHLRCVCVCVCGGRCVCV